VPGRPPSTLLRKWANSQGLTNRTLTDRLKAYRASHGAPIRAAQTRLLDVTEMAKGQYLPGLVTATEIAGMTGGQVPVSSWPATSGRRVRGDAR
jgi:hypothetical protein